MEVLVFLVPLALGLGLLGLAAFMWGIMNGQFDDLDGAPLRALDLDGVNYPAAKEGETQHGGATYRKR
jgi:cbb3-type cytochrome oxidase maturation protein